MVAGGVDSICVVALGVDSACVVDDTKVASCEVAPVVEVSG